MDDLINLAPALEVALVGALVALLPVVLVVRRSRRLGVTGWPAWQRVLTVLTLFLTLDLVVFGAFTRLTDSGLGCPDWPGCYGETSPFGAQAQISAAHAVLPSGPVSHGKAWIEMTHRYLATAVGALITGLMAMAWAKRHRPGALSPWWATGTFVWVCAQGAFGAMTVTMKLQPIIVTGHLIGALLGVGLLTAQARALDGEREGERRLGGHVSAAVDRAWSSARLRAVGWVVLAIVAAQVMLGGWVSTNYAVLACSEVPLCQGQWWPDMDVEMGFRLLRPLGGDGQGAYITLAGLTAIHMAHRLFAVVVLLSLVLYGAALRRWPAPANDATDDATQALPWRREGLFLWLLAAWQLASGLSNVVLGWPLFAALGHTLGATLLVWRLVHLLVCPRPVSFSVAESAAASVAEPDVNAATSAPHAPPDTGILHV